MEFPLVAFHGFVTLFTGGGEIATAPEMLDALLALPDGQALQSLEPLPPRRACGRPSTR